MDTTDDHQEGKRSVSDVQSPEESVSNEKLGMTSKMSASLKAVRIPAQLPELASVAEMIGGLFANGLNSTLPFKEILKVQEEFGRIAAFIDTSSKLAISEQALKSLTLYKAPTLAMATELSRITFGNSMITSNFAAQCADLRVVNLLAGIDLKKHATINAELAAQIKGIQGIANLVKTQNNFLSGLSPVVEVARPAVWATRAWNNVVRLTPSDVGTSYLERLDIAGRATSWAVHAGIVRTEEDEDELGLLEDEAISVLGVASASADLRRRLEEIDPQLCEKLDGAWERIHNGGRDATSQAANSLMEVVDWTLRILAPDNLVVAWHISDRRPAQELHDGRPTRSLRVRYAVRQHPEKSSALVLYLKTAQELAGTLQGTKHSLAKNGQQVLVPVAMLVEGLLHFVLID